MVGTDVILDRPDISDSDPNRVAFIEALDSRFASPMVYRSQTRSATVVYEIPLDSIRQNISVYYRNLDVVLSLSRTEIPHHPYERHGAFHNELVTTPGLVEADQFVFGIRLVDNNGRIGPRYVNINGRIYLVPACRRPDLPDGLHFKDNNRALGAVGLPPPATLKHYTMDDYDQACKDDLTMLRMFTTIELARTLGDMQTARKEELDRIAHERKLEEEDFRRQKLENDRENDQLKRRIEESDREWNERKRMWERRIDELDQQKKELEHQMKMQEFEARRRLEEVKHESTMRKMEREETGRDLDNISNIVKAIGIIVTGAATLYGIYVKTKKD